MHYGQRSAPLPAGLNSTNQAGGTYTTTGRQDVPRRLNVPRRLTVPRLDQPCRHVMYGVHGQTL